MYFFIGNKKLIQSELFFEVDDGDGGLDGFENSDEEYYNDETYIMFINHYDPHPSPITLQTKGC